MFHCVLEERADFCLIVFRCWCPFRNIQALLEQTNHHVYFSSALKGGPVAPSVLINCSYGWCHLAPPMLEVWGFWGWGSFYIYSPSMSTNCRRILEMEELIKLKKFPSLSSLEVGSVLLKEKHRVFLLHLGFKLCLRDCSVVPPITRLTSAVYRAHAYVKEIEFVVSLKFFKVPVWFTSKCLFSLIFKCFIISRKFSQTMWQRLTQDRVLVYSVVIFRIVVGSYEWKARCCQSGGPGKVCKELKQWNVCWRVFSQEERGQTCGRRQNKAQYNLHLT